MDDPFQCACGERLTVQLCGVTDLAAALAGTAQDVAEFFGCELRVEEDRVLGFTCAACLAMREEATDAR